MSSFQNALTFLHPVQYNDFGCLRVFVCSSVGLKYDVCIIRDGRIPIMDLWTRRYLWTHESTGQDPKLTIVRNTTIVKESNGH